MKTGIEWVADFEKTFPLPADRRIVVRVLVDAAIAEARREAVEECVAIARHDEMIGTQRLVSARLRALLPVEPKGTP